MYLQARAVFAISCTLGVRTPFFQFWQWQEVELLKVPMLNGKVVERLEGLPADDAAQLSVRSRLYTRSRRVWPVDFAARCADVELRS